MKKHSFSRRALGVLATIGLAACATVPESETKPAGTNVLSRKAINTAMKGRVDFVRHVKPILENKCVMCHNRRAMLGYMSLENQKEAKRTGALGSFIVSGHPEHSLLIAKVAGGYPMISSMPIVGMQTTAEERTILTKWVKEGAPWPAGASGTLRIPH
ncbi:MAG: Planctomycete cytochrome [Verrucomicrobiaceae bacterium]|nr:Planctomycete cytochrome [Verrucomicrobiaceae bacterium]